MKTEEEIRFIRNIFSRLLPNGCWEIDGAPNTEGRSEYRRSMGTTAHRKIFEIVYGDLPEGWCACHHCDNPKCGRPDHLFAGTHTDNMRDMRAKGRHPGKPGITHCKRGHPYAPGNIMQRKNRPGHRECLTCHRERERARKQRIREVN